MGKNNVLYKLIVIFTAICIMQTTYCSAGVAQNEVPIPPPTIPDQKLPDKISQDYALKSHSKELTKTKKLAADAAQITAEKQFPAKPKTLSVQPERTTQITEDTTQPESIEKEELPLPDELPEPEQLPEEPQSSPITDFLGAFAKAVLVLGSIFGAYKLYEKLKDQNLFIAVGQPKARRQGEPNTVEEAISSFVRHKIS